MIRREDWCSESTLQGTLPILYGLTVVGLIAVSGSTVFCPTVLHSTGPKRRSPDYYALSFANHILGRIYFMGRFGEKVRDEQGLAYYAYSELNAGYGRGPWLMRAGVNPTNLDKALASIHAELTRFLADGRSSTR